MWDGRGRDGGSVGTQVLSIEADSRERGMAAAQKNVKYLVSETSGKIGCAYFLLLCQLYFQRYAQYVFFPTFRHFFVEVYLNIKQWFSAERFLSPSGPLPLGTRQCLEALLAVAFRGPRKEDAPGI